MKEGNRQREEGTTWDEGPPPGSSVHAFSLLVSEKDPPVHWLQLFCDALAGMDSRGPRTPSPVSLSPTFG